MTRKLGVLAALWGAVGCSQNLDLDPPEADGGRVDAARGPTDGGLTDGRLPDAAAVDFRVDGGRDDAALPGCEDGDGDGRGDGCPAGPDCEDGDPRVYDGAEERCDGVDNDCDGQADERWPALGDRCEVGLGACASPGVFACADSGAGVFCDAQVGGAGEERCNSLDDDCDGVVDEDVAGCCDVGQVRACGLDVGACTLGEQICNADRVWEGCNGQGPRPETCEGTDQDCDGRTDEGVLNACGACGPEPAEVCNGRDDDCDGRADEGVANACGACGPEPAEVCNRRDDDCDGRTDEGVANACGACGPVPPEACNGRDDDCDGRTDEGVLNACGDCGPAPAEICNGQDDDCDGRADEGACRAFVLRDGEARWTTPPGLNNGGPFADGAGVQAAASFLLGGARIWAFSGATVWVYDPARDRWERSFPLATVSAAVRPPLQGAWVVPAWWSVRWGGEATANLGMVHGGQVQYVGVNPATGDMTPGNLADLATVWADDPNAPPPRSIRASRLALRDPRGWEDRAPADLCAAGADQLAAGPTGIHLADARYFTTDAGWCFRFWPPRPQRVWPGFALPGAPDPAAITAWTHAEPEAEGQGLDVVFTAP